MNYPKVFFSTNSIEDYPFGYYAKSSFDHYKKLSKNDNIIFVSKLDINKQKLINFSLSIFQSFFYFFKKSSLSQLYYKNVNIGPYVLSKANRSYYAVKSKLILNIRYIFFLTSTFKYIRQINNLTKNFEVVAAFIHEGYYLDGAIINFLNNNNRYILYKNELPISFSYRKITRKYDWHEVRVYPNIKSNNQDIIKDSKKWIDNGADIKYMRKNISEIPSKLDFKEKYDYLLLLHAFTDSNYAFGLDNTFDTKIDWLNYTLDKLKNKKVLIKSHPVFYDQKAIDGNKRVKWDLKYYKSLIAKHSNKTSFKFIDKPVDLIQLLRNLNKDCVVISHHGKGLIEASLMNFKIISSLYGVWRNYKLWPMWSNEKEYNNLLNTKFDDLDFINEEELANFLDFHFNNKLSGTNHYSHTILANKAAISNSLFTFNPKKYFVKAEQELFQELEKSIQKSDFNI